MPILGKISERANVKFGSENIRMLSVEALEEGQSLSDLARDLDLATRAYETAYLDSWPEAIQETIRATLKSAVQRQVPVQITWTAGYDFSVYVAEAKGVGNSQAQITIHLRGPYPEPSQTQVD
jgi:hypothetical protein